MHLWDFFVLFMIIIGVTVKDDSERAPATKANPPPRPKCNSLTLQEINLNTNPKRLLTSFGDDFTMELVTLKSSSGTNLIHR